MILPLNKKVLKMNTRENTINDIVKHNTTEQKLYFVLLAKYNAHIEFNQQDECVVSYSEIKELMNIKGSLSIPAIKKLIKSFITDSSIEVESSDEGLIVKYCNIPKRKETHIVYLEDLMKCRSVKQMKMFILLSSGNKYVYRNFLSSIIGSDNSSVAARKEATKTIKSLCKSMIKNGLMNSFTYVAEEKCFKVSPITTKKERIIKEKINENFSIIKTVPKTEVTIEVIQEEDDQESGYNHLFDINSIINKR